MTETMRMEVTRPVIRGKVHRAWVIGADLHYAGSITVGEDLLDAANIVEGQRVDIVDINNGRHLSTYTVAESRGSGIVQLNGTAAHLASVDSLVIIMACCQVFESQVQGWEPAVTFVDEHNRVIETGDSAGYVPEGPERARELGLGSAGKPWESG